MVCDFGTRSVFCLVFFFFKQKTAYEMRISDWSSDVCSSDLEAKYDGIFSIWYAKNLGVDRAFEVLRQGNLEGSAKNGGVLVVGADDEIGRASCRESVCQYV